MAMLRRADTDGNQAISQAEFDAALQAQLTAFGEQAIATLGLPLDQIRQEVDQVAGTLQFLRENQELLGISAARWNTDWRFVFLGVILLLAVIANRAIRTKAEGSRR